MSFRLQKTLYLDRGHTSRSRRGDRLPIGTVLHVAGMEDPFATRSGAAFGDDVTVGVEFDLANERFSVRNMTNGDEEPIDGLFPDFAGL